MQLITNSFISLVVLGCVISCATAPVSTTPTPVPGEPTPSEEPSPPPPPADKETQRPSVSPSETPREFHYGPETHRYIITRAAHIAQFPDTNVVREIPTTTQYVTLAVTDSGVVVSDPPPPTSLKCDTSATLYAQAQHLLPQLPSPIAIGNQWHDSVTVEGCRGSIPMTITRISDFSVVGDTLYEGQGALQIHQRSEIVAKGEGSEGEHRILLSITGSGITTWFIDVPGGKVLGSHSEQTSQVEVTTSGKKSTFLQRVTERVQLGDLLYGSHTK